MSTDTPETSINMFHDDTKNFIEIVPPLEEFEVVAMECTGAGERLFEKTSESENKTTLWNWRIRDAEHSIPPETLEAIKLVDLEKFTTRAFAHQVLLLRELKGHTVSITDNL